MPTKVPKGTGSDRSGRGNVVSTYPGDDAGKWQPSARQKNPWISGAGGSPSMSADQSASQKMGGAFFGPGTPEAYDGGDDVLWPREVDPDDVGECGFSAVGGYRCPQEANVSETLLRKFIKQALFEADNRTGALGPWGRAPTEWEDTPAPALGRMPYQPGENLEESDEELLTEPDDGDDYARENGDNVDEFSGAGGAAAGGGSIAGFVLPLGQGAPSLGGRKRKKPQNAVKGFKPTHG